VIKGLKIIFGALNVQYKRNLSALTYPCFQLLQCASKLFPVLRFSVIAPATADIAMRLALNVFMICFWDFQSLQSYCCTKLWFRTCDKHPNWSNQMAKSWEMDILICKVKTSQVSGCSAPFSFL